ncbi:MAG: hypothetical protein Q9220_002837 [cf. Caloplaca sp. 1 TL-2023]
MTNTTNATNRGWNRSTNMNTYVQNTPYGQYQTHGQPLQNLASEGYMENFDHSMGGLSQSMAGIALHNLDYTGISKQNGLGATNGLVNAQNFMAPQANQGMLYPLANGTFVYSDANGVQNGFSPYSAGYGLGAGQASQLQYALLQNMQTNAPVTPRGHAWMYNAHVPQEVPELAAARRTSLSSNEGDSPHTPLFPAYPGGYPTHLLAPHQRSNVMGPYSPSNPESPYQMAKKGTGEAELVDFEAWTTMSPAIPLAIPAIDSPGGGRGSLESIMDNPNGTTNVYVRGLHMETTDEMLLRYGERFGDVESAKSIIDTATGFCKGFGFIKYYNYINAENCIRGFYYRKYEAKFARVGHNERLKTLANPNNTNLYLSNLPKTMNEAELQAIFKSKHPDFIIVNHKVLKDENGLSRGVGFARFETHEICETIIEEFSGMVLDEEKDLRLQIRYADTDEQKDFKAKTAKSRQFKSTEYSRGIEWVKSFGYQSPTAAGFGSPLHAGMAGSNAMWMAPSPVSPVTTSYSLLTSFQTVPS